MRIYPTTIFLGAFLLFQVEPMIAKYILPWFGGTAAVWTTCLLFFQLLLLAGYTYAHAIESRLTPRTQVIVHLALLVSCVMLMGSLAITWTSPILPNAGWKPSRPDFPISQILLLLTVSIGLPYFFLSTTGPLLQAWFARTHEASPYRLYSLSNFGSLLALVTYPFVVEPRLNLRTQAAVWFTLFLLFAIAIGLCAQVLWKASAGSSSENVRTEVPAKDVPITVGTYLLWIALAACASLILLASTEQMTEDISPIPFLWILPLAIYLISFIICFDNERWYRRGIFHPLLAIAIPLNLVVFTNSDRVTLFLIRVSSAPDRMRLIIQIFSTCLLLFAICMVCHGELVRMRPHKRDLTAFYLMVSIGGALGGIVGAVIAPMLFLGNWELWIAISTCTLLLSIVVMKDRKSWIHEGKVALAIVLTIGALMLPELTGMIAATRTYNLMATILFVAFGILVVRRSRISVLARPGILLQFAVLAGVLSVAVVEVAAAVQEYRSELIVTRNFYGVLRVVSNNAIDPAWRGYELWHGEIMHGEQFSEPDKRYAPTSYFGPGSGIGLLLANHPNRLLPDRKDWALRVGVLGLGAGTIAAWGQLGDYIRYYEINPSIIEIATAPNGHFTYVRDSSAKVEIIPGDARLSMEHEIASGHSQNFDVLAMDAFSGDAVPVHLLTREAMRIYLDELKPEGVLAIHITNRYLDLLPITGELARSFNLRGGLVRDTPKGNVCEDSDWVLLSRGTKVLSQPEIASHLQSIDSPTRVRLWTDDYSNLFQILK